MDLKPKDIMTRQAFENAMVMIMATGGSTNAVLHIIAMARSAGIKLTIEDFQKVRDMLNNTRWRHRLAFQTFRSGGGGAGGNSH